MDPGLRRQFGKLGIINLCLVAKLVFILIGFVLLLEVGESCVLIGFNIGVNPGQLQEQSKALAQVQAVCSHLL